MNRRRIISTKMPRDWNVRKLGARARARARARANPNAE